MAKANKNFDDVNVEETNEQPVAKTAAVACDKLNVRKNANINADVVTIISKGDVVTLGNTREDSEWAKVTLADGTRGFAMKAFLE